eukprot:5808477-Amphidinium_carterae.1
MGKLVVSVAVPCLVTLVYHAECLGAWVLFWRPCTKERASLTIIVTMVGQEREQTLMSASDMCNVNRRVKWTACLD